MSQPDKFNINRLSCNQFDFLYCLNNLKCRFALKGKVTVVFRQQFVIAFAFSITNMLVFPKSGAKLM